MEAEIRLSANEFARAASQERATGGDHNDAGELNLASRAAFPRAVDYTGARLITRARD
jgi:hypothetical protein